MSHLLDRAARPPFSDGEGENPLFWPHLTSEHSHTGSWQPGSWSRYLAVFPSSSARSEGGRCDVILGGISVFSRLHGRFGKANAEVAVGLRWGPGIRSARAPQAYCRRQGNGTKPSGRGVQPAGYPGVLKMGDVGLAHRFPRPPVVSSALKASHECS